MKQTQNAHTERNVKRMVLLVGKCEGTVSLFGYNHRQEKKVIYMNSFDHFIVRSVRLVCMVRGRLEHTRDNTDIRAHCTHACLQPAHG